MAPIDILVHISGPCSGKDDTRYRSEARGFLEFEPVESHCLCELAGNETNENKERKETDLLEQDHVREKDILRDIRIQETWDSDYESINAEDEERLEDGEAIEGYEREALFNGPDLPNDRTSLDIGEKEIDVRQRIHQHPRTRVNCENPQGGRLTRLLEQFLLKLDQNHTPAKQGPTCSDNQASSNDALKLKTPFPKPAVGSPAAQWRGVKEKPHVLVSRTPALPRPRTAPTVQPLPHDQAPILRRTQSDSWQTPPSTIPDSQPIIQINSSFEIPSSPCLKRPFQSSLPSPTRNSPPGTKRPRLQVPSSPPMEAVRDLAVAEPRKGISQPPTGTPFSSPPPIEAIPESITEIPSSPPAPSKPDLPPSSEPLHIWAPRIISKQKFKTHITPSLAKLTTPLPLSRGFHPFITTQTHQIHTHDRGHWLIPLSTWPSEIKIYFWAALQRHIGGGDFGFSVNAVRLWENWEDGRESEVYVEGEAWEEVARVYCFGEVVGHVWMFLFVVSKKWVRGVGARWIRYHNEGPILTMM